MTLLHILPTPVFIFYVMPSLMCLGWAMMYLFRKKNTTQRMLFRILLFATVYFVFYSVYISPLADYHLMTRIDLLSQPLILAVLASCLIYLHAHLERPAVHQSLMQWFYMPPTVHGVSLWLLYYLIGIENAEQFMQAMDTSISNWSYRYLLADVPSQYDSILFRLFHLFDDIVFNMLCAVYIVLILGFCVLVSRRDGYKLGDGIRFWFKGKATTPHRAVSYWMAILLFSIIPLVLFGRTFYMLHPVFSALISLVTSAAVYCLCYCEYFSYLPKYTLHGLTDTELLTMPQNVNIEDDVLKSIPEKKESDLLVKKKSLIVEQLHQILEKDKGFTDPDITLDRLAQRIGTNRNRLSMIVNEEYGMEFRNIIATLRINEAKRMMLQNPSLTSEVISLRCGFRDTSAFFHRFKDIVGDTPRMWLTMQNNSGEMQ